MTVGQSLHSLKRSSKSIPDIPEPSPRPDSQPQRTSPTNQHPYKLMGGQDPDIPDKLIPGPLYPHWPCYRPIDTDTKVLRTTNLGPAAFLMHPHPTLRVPAFQGTGRRTAACRTQALDHSRTAQQGCSHAKEGNTAARGKASRFRTRCDLGPLTRKSHRDDPPKGPQSNVFPTWMSSRRILCQSGPPQKLQFRKLRSESPDNVPQGVAFSQGEKESEKKKQDTSTVPPALTGNGLGMHLPAARKHGMTDCLEPYLFYGNKRQRFQNPKGIGQDTHFKAQGTTATVSYTYFETHKARVAEAHVGGAPTPAASGRCSQGIVRGMSLFPLPPSMCLVWQSAEWHVNLVTSIPGKVSGTYGPYTAVSST
ncbi:uncharacterized protein CLUP02_13794 [Colletotrichum lupini]|uniref:Uncharacterized protein n=1 Tax=Colletotrichum lupini TaxID=145971 RepID=A0A9Q8T4Z8_9PEZI|nr:uncharacterized protein CLUP02_13794 [Colletotrichum lupini]UQC88271.1 hypothetical protein CLUP02_13794 [Colletotrichum lupini]